MARCVILSACPVSPALAGLLREDDFIIACDAGYRNCAPLHCKPHVIVGDFDTAPCPQQEDDEIVVLPHVKDDTDTEYAAKLAVQKGFDEVLLLGGLGGRRLEHTLANLCTGLGLEKRGVRAMLQDERSRITFVMPGETRRYPQRGLLLFLGVPHGRPCRGRLRAGFLLRTHRCRADRRLPAGCQQRIRRRLRLHHGVHSRRGTGHRGNGGGLILFRQFRNIPAANCL